MISLNKQPIWKTHLKMFLGLFFIILFLSVLVFYIFGLEPDELDFGWGGILEDSTTTLSVKTSNNKDVVAMLPTHISIPKINVDTNVSNPESDNVSILDEYLKKGSVHYPGSGDINSGNMFLFAHSTGFKVVQNQAYKAFNNLKSLSSGDDIYITGEDNKIYSYKVKNVKLASASDVLVRFDSGEHMLTLSTCNTFGQKEERYVVEASFVGIK